MEKEFYTTFEVGKLCQVYHTTVINWINKGQLKAYTTLGRHRRIQRADLLNFMSRCGIRIPSELKHANKKVLVVDDDKSIQRLIQRIIIKSFLGTDVESVDNGVEALVSVGRHVPDLIVLDIVMPGMDGLEVCKLLRSNPTTRSMKIIAITGKKLAAEEEKFLKKNVDDFFRKPFSPLKLQHSIATLLKTEGAPHAVTYP
jgi:excisionase family DNA binding protein